MKALVYTGPETLIHTDVPDPAADTVVAVSHVGICGSDMHAFLGHDDRRPAPLILGHEAAGTTPGGTRVAVNPLVPCTGCAACRAGRTNLCPARQILSMPPRPGAFAERVAAPADNLVETTLPSAQAALAEPLAVCWHAVRLGLRLAEATSATVIGGGAIGVGCALALAAHGVAALVAEPNPLRRAYLDRMGLDATPEATEPATLVIDAVGIGPTRAAASRIARPGGAIVHVGLGDAAPGLDVRRLTLQEVAFAGAYTYTAREFRDTVRAMEAGRLGPLDWWEERPLSEGPRAFADLRAGRVAAPKILLRP